MSISSLGSSAFINSTGNTDTSLNKSPPVTLSQEAQGFAELASQGITAFTIRDGKRALQDLLDGKSSSAASLGGNVGGAISYPDFEELMRQFGATPAETDRLKRSFDVNGDRSISNDEMLRGLAATIGGRGSSPDVQVLLGLMDKGGNGDGVVQQDEFLGVETMLAHVQKKLP